MNPITFNYTGAIQNYTVPVTGTYDLSAFGAGGGSTDAGAGGSGAQIGATFNLTAGQQLFIIVGGVGGSAGDGVRNGAGGGGFSEIYTRDANGNITPLIIAGGGGGATGSVAGGGNASVADPTTLGGGGSASFSQNSGNGNAGSSGGGGAGANGDGVSGPSIAGTVGGQGGMTAANGAAGGTVATPGGFGGGGGGGSATGTSFGGGGGGGGASGGGAAGGNGAGGLAQTARGGTSYISNTGVQNFQETMAGANVSRGNGSVRILPPGNNVPCYCTGTRILTDRGAVAVEDLAIGDTVVTASGARRPIRWIGTRSYGGRFANTNPAVLPVCVRTGALADGIPTRDLWVSPDHALFLDGLLVPAELLVNGASVTRAERIESVTYWHVELDSHDVLLAEGAPAESYVDDGGRAIFHNAESHRALYPHATPTATVYCAPRVADDGAHGYALEAIRRRLAIRAGLPVAPERVFGDLRGYLDLCEVRPGSLRVAGWAQDAAHSGAPVCLDVVVDGTVVALVYTGTYRADVEAAGIGDGCCGFDLDLDETLSPGASHTIELRRSADGVSIGLLRVDASGAWTRPMAA